LEALFTDFLVFIKITSQLTETHAQHQKEVEAFSWEELEQ
ncbi:MAG: NADPH-dependent FMN reductase, partial [Streptococcus gallolyticus]|nr:NADPH-dependent FMN reductase [Streptococcus gallolyticus]